MPFVVNASLMVVVCYAVHAFFKRVFCCCKFSFLFIADNESIPLHISGHYFYFYFLNVHSAEKCLKSKLQILMKLVFGCQSEWIKLQES